MHNRIRLIDHQVRRFFWLIFTLLGQRSRKDCSCSADYITVQPRGSVLVLTDFTGAALDRDALRAMKETAVFDKPFVKRPALIGTESLPWDFYEDLTSFSRRELLIFKTREQALAWLAGDSVAP